MDACSKPDNEMQEEKIHYFGSSWEEKEEAPSDEEEEFFLAYEEWKKTYFSDSSGEEKGESPSDEEEEFFLACEKMFDDEESPSTSCSTGARPKGTTEKESPSISGTTGARPKQTVEKDCIQLSDSIWMFSKKRISSHGEIYEGELRSGVHDARPIVLKLVKNIPQSITEARILAKLNNHSHILSLIHADTFEFRLEDHIYIALDKCHHENLCEFVTNRKNQGLAFNFDRAIKIAKQMVDGMKHIHENRIIHKDLKPDNILLSLDLKLIKIADFGLSQEIDSISTEIFEKGQFGTDGFRPPESFGRGIISQKSDIFSLGVTFYFVLSNGEHPFGDDPDGWNHHMKYGKISFSHLLVPNIKTTEHLIKSMIEHKINDRPTIWQVSEHPFWTGNEVPCDFELVNTYQVEIEMCLASNGREAYKFICNFNLPCGGYRQTDYHCPESSMSLIPPTSEPSFDIADVDVDQLLEHVKKIQLRDEAAAAKICQRTKDSGDNLTAEQTEVQFETSTETEEPGATAEGFPSNEPLQLDFQYRQLDADGEIGPEGGSLSVDECSLIVRPKSLADNQNLGISMSMNFKNLCLPADKVPISPYFDIKCRGKLRIPAIARIPTWFMPSKDLQHGIKIYKRYRDEENKFTWRELPNEVKVRDGIIEFEVDHFCGFIAMIKDLWHWARGEIRLSHGLLHCGENFLSAICYQSPESLFRQMMAHLKEIGHKEIYSNRFVMKSAQKVPIKMECFDPHLHEFGPQQHLLTPSDVRANQQNQFPFLLRHLEGPKIEVDIKYIVNDLIAPFHVRLLDTKDDERE